MSADFVRTEGVRFSLGDRAFPVAGVNCYFLSYCSEESRRAVFGAACAMGANVVRSNAFLDTPAAAPGRVAFQYLDGGRIVQNGGPDGLDRLDALIAAAEELSFKLVLPFVNYWDDFGGMQQYLNWLGISGSRDVFYREPAAREAYRRWVETLLTRRNTRTGRAYADEPSIMAWELANEPRCYLTGGRELLLDWAGEMSAHVKSLDRNHLLAVGDEGFDGALLNFGGIDYGTCHLYPKNMGHGPEFGATWIGDHVAACARANKPMMLAEYGLTLDEVGNAPAVRRAWYSKWIEAVRDAGGAGHLVWMLGCRNPDVADFQDGYTVYSEDEIPPLLGEK
jgi:mannan endo-1,4-beta-mannosidase